MVREEKRRDGKEGKGKEMCEERKRYSATGVRDRKCCAQRYIFI
jgi:hypothetical protein